MKSFHVSIVGNIGVGKSTLANAIAKNINCSLYLEDPQKYPFVNDAFSDPQRWSFTNQVQFMLSKACEQENILRSESICIQEIDFQATHMIWTPVLHDLSFLDAREVQLLNQIYRLLEAGVYSSPDVYLYIQCKPETVLKRIAERNRGFETGFQETKKLVNQVDFYLKQFIRGLPVEVLEIDSEKINFIEDFEFISQLSKTILEKANQKNQGDQ